MKKIINITLIATVSFLFNACTSSSIAVAESASFKLGKKDGCMTATGEYAKDSQAFNADKEYKNGWYAGRKNCNPLQEK